MPPASISPPASADSTSSSASTRSFCNGGPGKISPFFIPAAIINLASGHVSIRYGAKGPNSATATACSASAHAIGDAYKIIQRCDAEVMIAGGSEAAVTPMGIGGFAAMRALSTRNDEPERASRPFDAQRDGFVVGEGAGVLILESLEFAQRRGANILAEIVGYGMSGDAYHITQPAEQGDGGYRVSHGGHARTPRFRPDDIGYVNAHGTSTPIGDAIETTALKRVFGERAKKVPISSTKSMTGHLLGGAGGLEAGISVLALRDQILPPTINQETPDPALRSRLRSESRAQGRSGLRAFEFLRLRRHQRLLVFKRWEGAASGALSPFAFTQRQSSDEGVSVRGRIVKIGVCVKQVPAKDAPLAIVDGGAWIREADIGFETNEPDSYALEEALRLKEKHDGEVVAISMGPERVKQTIKEALAKGADRGIHIADNEFYKLDPLASARSLAAAIEAENFDLILTGLQSDDQGFGQTGVLLAELLGRPHATIIMAIEVIDGRPEAEARTRSRMVPVGRVAASRRAHDSVRHQQAALRHAQGHHGREEKRNRHGRPRIARRAGYADAAHRAHLRAAKNQEDRIHHRHAQRNRRQAHRKTQARSARAVA